MDTNAGKPGYRALRKGRISIPGQVYLVTTICHDRRALFRDPATANSVAATIADTRLWRDSILLCWVLMPDHLHALLQLGTTESLSKLLQRVKAVCARAAGQASPRTSARVWMPGFHDRALRRDEDARLHAIWSPIHCAPDWQNPRANILIGT